MTPLDSSADSEIDSLRYLRESCGTYLYRLEFNTFVVEKFQLMYLDTPKTAGTSIKSRLVELAGFNARFDDSFSRETEKEMFIHDRMLNPLKSVAQYPDAVQAKILFSDSWKRFCVVRNPYDRLFSAWFSKVLLRQPGYIQDLPGFHLQDSFKSEIEIYRAFESFVAYLHKNGVNSNPHWDVQFLLLFGNCIPWTTVMRYEALQAELLQARQLFSGLEFRIDSLNMSGMSPDWSLVSDTTMDIIASLYRADFDAYGYPTSSPENRVPQNLLLVYVNGLIGRNNRLLQMFERDDKKMAEILQLKNAIVELEGAVQKIQKETIELAEQRHYLSSQCEQLKEEKKLLEVRLLLLREEFDSLLGSNSWKITAPLRRMRNLFPKKIEDK